METLCFLKFVGTHHATKCEIKKLSKVDWQLIIDHENISILVKVWVHCLIFPNFLYFLYAIILINVLYVVKCGHQPRRLIN